MISRRVFRPPEMKLTVSEARTAFEREADALDIVPFGAGAVTRSLDDDIVITPLWNEAVSFSDAEGAYVVVPFNLPLGKIFARKQFDEEIPEDEKFANTDIRLFIEKKHENEYLYSIIHLTVIILMSWRKVMTWPRCDWMIWHLSPALSVITVCKVK